MASLATMTEKTTNKVPQPNPGEGAHPPQATNFAKLPEVRRR